ncbi:zinc carboxypeptidase A 1-like [Hetaerina americana]|uniref:zinc carboxypeptidase A 1-like n=1 Tax=Hetaerina americana TaxID=62018 RepID=UPI003A7F2625
MAIRYLILLAVVAGCMAVPLEESEAVKARFDNYKVFRVTPTTDEQVKILQQVEELDNGLSFWVSASQKGKPADIMVPPHKLPMATTMFKTLDLNHRVMVENVQRLIDEERPKQLRASSGFGWEDYHSLDEIKSVLMTDAWLLMQNAFPQS